jgi:hypothetical protein
VIALPGGVDKHPESITVKGLADWRCRGDLKAGNLDVPAMAAKASAEARRLKRKSPSHPPNPLRFMFS